MIAGPYRQGSSDAELWKSNLQKLNEAALEVFKKGHTPLIGVNAVLPIIEIAGFEHFDKMMMPVCLVLADKCDAVLRIGGNSAGADEEVKVFLQKGLPVYYDVATLP